MVDATAIVATRPDPRLARRARLLSSLTLGWNVVEAVVAIGAGVVAGSVALVGFGIDSVVECLAAVAVLWRFTGARTDSEAAERRAQRAVALAFFALAAYVSVDAVRALAFAVRPDASPVGVAITALSLAVMPPLALAQRRNARRLGSAAALGESGQTWLCVALSGVALAGLLANATAGWWWADPIAGLVIAVVALREGRETWRGDGCCAPGSGCSA